MDTVERAISLIHNFQGFNQKVAFGFLMRLGKTYNKIIVIIYMRLA